ncbi:MAG: hypothetical protein HQ478_12125 [Chloroflexi bacterium]|nr:hypothetical protein [Chloroflexota bacterium]
MNSQNKLKLATATLAFAVLAASIAVTTALSLRDEEANIEELAAADQTQSLPIADDIDTNTEALGMPEPLFIEGEPITVFDGEMKVLPDGSVSISNPDVELMPVPPEQPADTLPSDGIAIGESNPPSQDPAIEGSEWMESGVSSGSAGAAVGPVVVNASEIEEAPTPEPGVVHVVPIGTFLDDVQVD